MFWTSEGKGWGLRTLQDLPKAAFVCEYIGEIVTNSELHDRNLQNSGNEKHTYPVLLDADWVSEGVLKDEEALCLDATTYGNVARFINHRYSCNVCDVCVICFAFDVIILANAFSLPFFIEIYTFVIQVIALHTELYPLEKQIM